ncbi:MAG: DUF4445 domain-containing protein [Armatimonadetes bacterium]|nr:DUF4445 domain-containing protein [Armatimonadota bacterium]
MRIEEVNSIDRRQAGTRLLRVVFEPDGIETFVPAGTTIAKAALAVGCAVEMPCGGMGTCGKCRVEVQEGVSEPDASELRLLSPEALSDGVRLACRTKIERKTTITVPATSRSLVQKILSQGLFRDVHVSPAVSKVYLQLPKPSITDERGEFERLAAGISMYDLEPGIGTKLAQRLPRILRGSDYEVTAVVADSELIAVEPGNTVRRNYGIAFDLGSTTVVGYLIDLNTGHEVAVASAMNAQMAYGDDLVSRINFAMTEPDGLGMLRVTVIDVLNRIIRQLADAQDIDGDSVYEVTLVGNTCMSHIFLGLDVSTLGLSPYVPTIARAMVVCAEEVGLNICPGGHVHVLPNVAGFVGSDLVGVALSTLREDEDHTRLAVDVGTNGEMALIHKGQLYACSAAAGPAFEGARISCGMRGGPGAIDSVKIGDTVEITTVDGRRAIGLCGSGLVDAVAEMLKAGIIDSTGRMLAPDEAGHLPQAVRERLIEVDGSVEFILATEREAARREPITLTQRDIRQLQLAKGSIRAAIETLLHVAGATSEDLYEIVLAGAFGNYIRIESALGIGLLPPIDIERIVPVGNAAGTGAKLALISVRERERASRLAERTEHIELATHPEYESQFMDKMLFPESLGKAAIS